MTNKILSLLVSIFVFCYVNAQTQQGIVKTRGRMVNGVLQPGKGLQGATVQIKDRSAVVSGTNGKFSFPLRAKAYFVQSVKKQGYQLVDMEACRNYQYSTSPLYLVMETPDQLRSDQIEAQKKIRSSLRNQLTQKEEEIEKLNASLAEKEQLLERLYQQQHENENLIADMVARYATIDYDQMDDFYRQVSYFIEEGELIRADSLLRSRGDLNNQVAEQLRQEETVQLQKKQIAMVEAGLKAKKDELARRCYSYYEAFCLQFQNDSAAHYIDLRASLDTTCLEWQFQAANYHSRQHHIEKAEHYYLRVLNQIAALPTNETDEYLPMQAATKNNLGFLYEYIKQTELSESCYKDALHIRTKLANINHDTYIPQVAQTMINLGMLYAANGHFDASDKLLTEAVRVLDSLAVEKPRKYLPMIAATQSSLATLYMGTNQADQQSLALCLMERALETYRQLAQQAPRRFEPDVAATLSNMTLLYYRMNQFDKGRSCFQEAIEIYVQLAQRNPNAYRSSLNGLINNLARIAVELNDKGYACEKADQLLRGRTYYEESLAIYEKLAELQPETYRSYLARELGNLSFNAILLKDFKQAESYAIHGISTDPNKIFVYANLAEALMLQGKQKEAESVVVGHLSDLKAILLEDLDNLSRRGIIGDDRLAGAERIKTIILKNGSID